MKTVKKYKNFIFIFAKIVFSILCFWFLLKQVNFNQIKTDFSKINLNKFFLSVVCLSISTIFVGIRHYFICLELRIKANLRFVQILSWKGTFFNQILPGGISGDAYKIFQLIGFQKQNNLEKNKFLCTFSVFFDRFTGISITMLCMPIICIFLKIDILLKQITLTICFAFFIGIIVLFLLIKFKHHLKNKFLNEVFEKLNNVNLFSCKILLCAFIIAVFNTYSYYFLTLSFDFYINYFEVFCFSALSFVVAIIPISIASWGIRENFLYFWFNKQNYPLDLAVSLGISYGIALLILGFIGGIFYLLDNKKIKY